MGQNITWSFIHDFKKLLLLEYKTNTNDDSAKKRYEHYFIEETLLPWILKSGQYLDT